MAKKLLAEILELTVPERIQLVHDIWDSIAQVPELRALADEQKQEPRPRLAHYRSPWIKTFLGGPKTKNRSITLKTAVAVRAAAQMTESAAAFLFSVLTLTVPGFRAKNKKSFALSVICTTVLSLTAVLGSTALQLYLKNRRLEMER